MVHLELWFNSLLFYLAVINVSLTLSVNSPKALHTHTISEISQTEIPDLNFSPPKEEMVNSEQLPIPNDQQTSKISKSRKRTGLAAELHRLKDRERKRKSGISKEEREAENKKHRESNKKRLAEFPELAERYRKLNNEASKRLRERKKAKKQGVEVNAKNAIRRLPSDLHLRR